MSGQRVVQNSGSVNQRLQAYITIKIRYLHKDHLGSITAITNEAGNEVESFSFDPWGKRRAVTLTQLQDFLGSWSTLNSYQKGNLTIPALSLASLTTDRGFTGHRQMDGVGLIHMGGRVYDAEIGRFLSADPFVRDTTNLQALNRYTYVENNPLSYTDPSGYFLKKLVKGIGKAIGKLVDAIGNAIKVGLQKIGRAFAEIPGLSAALTVVGCVALPAACVAIQQGMMALGTAITAVNGGTIDQILSGLAIGAITSGVPGGGGFWEGGLTSALAKGLGDSTQAFAGSMMFMGGAVAKAQGGKFIDGVKGAAIGFGVSYGIARIAMAGDGAANANPPDTDIPPAANLKLRGKIYENDGTLNIDITVRNGSPLWGSSLSDTTFSRQLQNIVSDFRHANVKVNFTIVQSGPADLVYFSHSHINGYDYRRGGAIAYSDSGSRSSTSSHEFFHFLTGRGHAKGGTGSIRSYDVNRAIVKDDVELIRRLYVE